MVEFTKEEIEQDRQSSIEKLPEQYDESLDDLKLRYNHPIAYSEVLHAAFMLMENVEHYMADNPAIMLDEQAYHLARQADTALFNLYQRIGQLRSESDAENITDRPAPE